MFAKDDVGSCHRSKARWECAISDWREGTGTVRAIAQDGEGKTSAIGLSVNGSHAVPRFILASAGTLIAHHLTADEAAGRGATRRPWTDACV